MRYSGRFVQTAALCCSLTCMAALPAVAESVVSNAVAHQRTDGSQVVDITYQMSGATAATSVSLQISTDDGAMWPIRPAPAARPTARACTGAGRPVSVQSPP